MNDTATEHAADPDRRENWLPWIERCADGLLVVTVFGSVLAMGTVHTSVLLVVAVVSALAAMGQCLTRAPLARDGRILIGTLTGLAVWTALQAVPLPFGWLEHIAGNNAAVWRDAALVVSGAEPRRASISCDPGASMVEALKLVTYTNVAFAAIGFGSRRGARKVALCVLVAGCVVSVVTLAHSLGGATKIYGIIEPSSGIGPWHFGPLLNPNNLAGYLTLAALAGLGLLNLQRPPAPRMILVVVVTIVIGTIGIAASRGGFFAFLAGALVLVIATELIRRRVRRGTLASRRVMLLGAAAAVIAGAGIFLAASTWNVWSEIRSQDVDKLILARRVVPLIGEHLWLGIGRGSFESVFPAYYIGQNEIVFTHAENFVLQWVAEWGVVVAALALAAFGYCLRPRVAGLVKRPSALGLYAGAVALVLQNLVDLGFEVPGLTIALVVTIAGIVGAAGSGPPTRKRPSKWKFALPATATLAASAAVAAWGMHSVGADREAVRVAVSEMNDPASVAAARALVTEALSRHPGEPYLARAGAVVASAAHERTAMRWAAQALRRGPDSARTHLLLSQLLAANGAREQALLELRLAAERDHRIPHLIASAAIRLGTDAEALERAVPDGVPGAAVLVGLAERLPPAERVTRERLLAEAIARNPGLSSAHLLAGRMILARLGDRSCDEGERVECLARVEHHATALEDSGDGLGSLTLRTERDIALGVADSAERRLAERCPALVVREPCHRLRVEAAAATGNRERFIAAADAYAPHVCASAQACSNVFQWFGDLATQHGFPGIAVGYYQRSAREAPSTDAWLRAAVAARAAGDRARADAALRHAERMLVETPAARERIEAERARWADTELSRRP